jgi:hypothetical protein
MAGEYVCPNYDRQTRECGVRPDGAFLGCAADPFDPEGCVWRLDQAQLPKVTVNTPSRSGYVPAAVVGIRMPH